MRPIDADSLLAELTSFYKKVEEESRYTGNRTINVSWDDAITAIKNAPTIEPEQRWIPLTERMPEDDVEVIVSCTDDSGDTSFSFTTVAWHFKGTWICNNERCFFITAWMPLPKAYKGGEEDEL